MRKPAYNHIIKSFCLNMVTGSSFVYDIQQTKQGSTVWITSIHIKHLLFPHTHAHTFLLLSQSMPVAIGKKFFPLLSL